jgi:thiosulfate/3-mercaptopyruvate sulfurtransferase
MTDNLRSRTEQVVDARSAGRFAGTEPEPRAGLRGGHIPGSKNLPFDTLFNEDGTYKSTDAIKAAFAEAGIDLAKPVIGTCGSGVTSAVLAFAAALVGHNKMAIYDGSWSEWGANAHNPVVTGA